MTANHPPALGPALLTRGGTIHILIGIKTVAAVAAVLGYSFNSLPEDNFRSWYAVNWEFSLSFRFWPLCTGPSYEQFQCLHGRRLALALDS